MKYSEKVETDKIRQNALPVVNLFEHLFSNFKFQFNFLWSVANSHSSIKWEPILQLWLLVNPPNKTQTITDYHTKQKTRKYTRTPYRRATKQIHLTSQYKYWKSEMCSFLMEVMANIMFSFFLCKRNQNNLNFTKCLSESTAQTH